MFDNLAGKSPQETFWLKLMNTRIQRKFLKMKERQEGCLNLPTFDEYYSCVRGESDYLEMFMLQMGFYQRKFEKCIE
jgi:hypothetical protein